MTEYEKLEADQEPKEPLERQHPYFMPIAAFVHNENLSYLRASLKKLPVGKHIASLGVQFQGRPHLYSSNPFEVTRLAFPWPGNQFMYLTLRKTCWLTMDVGKNPIHGRDWTKEFQEHSELPRPD